MTRTVRAAHPALPDDIGDLRTQRPLPNAELEQLDPFLFLNRVEGGLVRLSSSSLCNISSGGGETALLILEDG